MKTLRSLSLGFCFLIVGCHARLFVPALGAAISIRSVTDSDFGFQYVGKNTDRVFMLINDGLGPAVITSPAITNSQFIFKDGQYPGTGGNCGPVIPAATSCTIVLSFVPEVVGVQESELQFNYQSDGIGGSSKQKVSGNGVVTGLLDAAFGTGGISKLSIGNGNNDRITSVFPLPDGKFLVSGTSQDLVSGRSLFAVARYYADGTLDSSYGTGGSRTVDIGPTMNPWRAALQSDGKVVFVGNYYNGTAYVHSMLRFTDEGDLDTSFGTGGIQITPTAGQTAICAVVQNDGRIVTGGAGPAAGGGYFTVARFLTDGSLDTSFGVGGIRSHPVGPSGGYARDLAIQDDGSIVAVGQSMDGGGVYTQFTVVRYTSSGALDGTFGNTGVTVSNLGIGNNDAYAVAIQGDGKVLMAGETIIGTRRAFTVARYTTSGVLDTTFAGGAGYAATSFTVNGVLSHSLARAMLLKPDGKIFVLGTVSPVTGQVPFAFARFNADGTLDTSFHQTGRLTLNSPVLGNLSSASAMAEQADGKTLAAGFTADGAVTRFAVMRIW